MTADCLDFDLPPGDAETFAAHPLLAACPVSHQRLQEVYHDSPGRALRGLGLSLRTRWADGRWLQTLDTLEGGELIAEAPVEGREADRTKLPVRGRIGRRLGEALGDAALEPVCEVEARRSLWSLTLAGGARVDLILDQGRLRAGDRVEPLCRLRLLGRSGPGAVYGLALRLAADRPLPLAGEDVAGRAHGLLSGRPVTHRKAAKLELAAGTSAEQAFLAIVRSCLAHLRANVEAARREQVEGVHQMRVALRRLRACLKVYRPLIDRAAGADLVAELRWLNRWLGPCRDWDVFITEGLEPMVAGVAGKRGPRDLLRKAQAIRAAHYRQLRQALDEPRFHHLVLAAYAWLAERAWRPGLGPEQRDGLGRPARSFATAVLRRDHRRVMKRGRAFRELSDSERHQLRIRIKELRYALDFFASLYPQPKAGAYVDAAAGLQDSLGVLNDAATARGLLDEAGLGGGSGVRQFVEGWYACKQDIYEARFPKAWKRFTDCGKPWKTG